MLEISQFSFYSNFDRDIYLTLVLKTKPGLRLKSHTLLSKHLR